MQGVSTQPPPTATPTQSPQIHSTPPHVATPPHHLVFPLRPHSLSLQSRSLSLCRIITTPPQPPSHGSTPLPRFNPPPPPRLIPRCFPAPANNVRCYLLQGLIDLRLRRLIGSAQCFWEETATSHLPPPPKVRAEGSVEEVSHPASPPDSPSSPSRSIRCG